jgi:hypothetical protein
VGAKESGEWERKKGKMKIEKGKLGGFEWAMRDWDRRAVTAVTMAIPYRIETSVWPVRMRQAKALGRLGLCR